MSSPANRSSIFGWMPKKHLSSPSSESIDNNSNSNNIINSNINSNNNNNHNNSNNNNIHSNNNNNNNNNNNSNSINNINNININNLISRSPTKYNQNSDSLSTSFSRVRSNSNSLMQNNIIGEYFGISLDDALEKSSAKISILSSDASGSAQYGVIPIIVAKCGVYLKKNGLTVEGIFRVNGSAKRLKELQIIFDSGPNFGKKLNWDGYNVHDAASILRRYLNALPEPLISFEFYQDFRNVLSTRVINYLKFKTENELIRENNKKLNNEILVQSIPISQEEIESKTKKKSRNYKKLTNDVHSAIEKYKKLIDLLPISSKQLLFYILDLLAMVQNHSKENLMSSRNLAAIFQPSILSHPNHDLEPEEYALSQLVVEFLIRYAYKLLPKQEESKPENNTLIKPQLHHSDSETTNEDLLGQQNLQVSQAPIPFDSDLEFSDEANEIGSGSGSDIDNEFQTLKITNGHDSNPNPNPKLIVSTPSEDI
ncbi:unnamed protein product [Candida verbasci]|uniref:Rho-GAP domain-containing protein n=1 Tax=Candida verbasci TaxID=1227364 RepID=A0A9W4TZ61_9ASCO|nr:unnamed protein product [Candida verbasci]